MTVQKYANYVIALFITIIIVIYFSLGEMSTAYAQEASTINSFDADSYYIGKNTRKLFGIIIAGVAIWGAIKGWRRAVVVGCFLIFLGLASIGLFCYGKLIAFWLNSTGSKLIPTMVFFTGGILFIGILHKLYTLMNDFLKKHLF